MCILYIHQYCTVCLSAWYCNEYVMQDIHCAMQYVQGSVQDVQCIILPSRICNAWYCKAHSAPNIVLLLLLVSLCVSIWCGGTPHQCRAQPVKLSLSNCFCIGRQFPGGTNCPHILGIKLHKNNKGPKIKYWPDPPAFVHPTSKLRDIEQKKHKNWTKKASKKDFLTSGSAATLLAPGSLYLGYLGFFLK